MKMEKLVIEGCPRDPKEDAKLHPDLTHPNPPRNVVKPCEATAKCLHVHGHAGRCRTTDECLCDLDAYCEIHNQRGSSQPRAPRAAHKTDMALPDHLLKGF